MAARRRPVKNPAASALARRRWAGTTAAERTEAARLAVQARWARWRAAKAAAAATPPSAPKRAPRR